MPIHHRQPGGSASTPTSASFTIHGIRCLSSRRLILSNESSNAKVLIFPEGVVPRWTEATDAFWQATIDHAAQRGAVLLIGANVPSPNPTPRFRNIIAVRGSSTAEFEQRVPVPLAMWKPWGKDRVSLNLTGNATEEIDGERAAIFICYEQLLPWSYLSALATQPTVFVGVANASWTKHTVVPQYQKAVLLSWARLFGKPVITATNY
jgi:apolipoprotein N-acyltransferase